MTRVTYDAARLEWSTRFAYSREMAAFLRRFAGVRPGMRVVELGCGSGFWGRLLMPALRGRGSLLGIDLDATLVARARALARVERVNVAAVRLRLAYRVGDAARTGLRANSVDLVTCHRLLCVVPRPERILREMVRIARSGGLVVANEHVHGEQPFFDPDDPELRELNAERDRAWVRGFKRLVGGDHRIGERVAALFVGAGLRDVRAEGVLAPASAHPFDSRVPLAEARAYFEYLRDSLARGDAVRERIYRAGGWTARHERRFVARALATIERRLRDGDLRSWGRLSAVPRVIVRGTVLAS